MLIKRKVTSANDLQDVESINLTGNNKKPLPQRPDCGGGFEVDSYEAEYIFCVEENGWMFAA